MDKKGAAQQRVARQWVAATHHAILSRPSGPCQVRRVQFQQAQPGANLGIRDDGG
jgi:hypothetical protein